MERENQRIAITKRLLKESLMKILQTKDLDTISVAELCRDAGINRATFYRHYQIPKDILMEIQRDFYLRLRQEVKIPESVENLRNVIETLCSCMNENLELVRILIKNNSDANFTNFINDIFLELVTEYRHIGITDKLNQEDIRFLALYSAGGSYFVLRSWAMGSSQKSPAEIAGYLYHLASRTESFLLNLLSDKDKNTVSGL